MTDLKLRRYVVDSTRPGWMTVRVPDEHGSYQLLEVTASDDFIAEPEDSVLLPLTGPVPAKPIPEKINTNESRGQFVDVSVQNWPNIGAPDHTGVGGTLDIILDRRPRGLQAWGTQLGSAPGTTSSIGWFEVQGTLYPGRRYRVSTSPLTVVSTVNGDRASVQIRYTSEVGSLPYSPEVTSTLLTSRPVSIPDANGGAAVLAQTISTGVDVTQCRFLLCYTRLSGTGTISVPGLAELLVEDIGPAVTNTSVLNTGGDVVVPPVETTVTFPSLWTATYVESGNKATGTTEAIQGQSTGLTSQRRGLIGFGDLSGDLTGASIISVVVKLHAIFWKSVSGGTGVLGTHGYVTEPATYMPGAADEDLQREPLWPRGATRYVDITALDPGDWVDGTVTGIVMGDDLGSDGEFYGRFAGFDDADTTLRPELIITYNA